MAKTLATTVPVYEYTGPPWRLPYEILRPPTTIWNHRRPPLLASRQNREHGADMNWTSSTGPCCCRYSERVRRGPPLPRRAMTEKVKISRRCKKKKEKKRSGGAGVCNGKLSPRSWHARGDSPPHPRGPRRRSVQEDSSECNQSNQRLFLSPS